MIFLKLITLTCKKLEFDAIKSQTYSFFRFYAIPFEVKSALVLTIVVIFFHILDRQIEFTSRTDYLWKAKLKVEQEEVETMRGINKVKNLKQKKTFWINFLLDSSGKHLTCPCCRTFFELSRHARTLSREVLMYSRNVRINTQLQRILRWEWRQ